jgi:hypothetical protein
LEKRNKKLLVALAPISRVWVRVRLYAFLGSFFEKEPLG